MISRFTRAQISLCPQKVVPMLTFQTLSSPPDFPPTLSVLVVSASLLPSKVLLFFNLPLSNGKSRKSHFGALSVFLNGGTL